MLRGLAWRIEFQQASAVWPDRVRPEASVMVIESITGSRERRSRKSSSKAKMAAFRLRVSKVFFLALISLP